MLLTRIAGLVRGLSVPNYPEGAEDKQFALSNRGGQLMAQDLPELTEVVRLGETWQAMLATPAAPLIVVPTTTALLSLYNGEPDGGKCYVIDSIFALKVANDAAASLLTIMAMNNVIPCQNVPPVGPLTVRSTSGRKYGGKALLPTNYLVTNDGWFPHGYPAPSSQSATVELGQAVDVPIRGLYIIPPRGQFNLHVLAAVATAASVLVGVRWHEIQLIWKA